VTVEEWLQLRKRPPANALLVLGLTDCAPCDILEQALPLLALDADIVLYKARLELSDKRAVAKVLLSGIREFPFVELYREGLRTGNKCGLRAQSAEAAAEELQKQFGLAAPKSSAAWFEAPSPIDSDVAMSLGTNRFRGQRSA
jgi:hypothetical protein